MQIMPETDFSLTPFDVRRLFLDFLEDHSVTQAT